jgi:glycosyltransferase involved in cell wall biosynthesis
MIISKNPLTIVATILCKNEEDVIAANIEHHVNQGVKNFIVTDNNSKDKTKEIISKYPEVVELIDETDDDHHQSKWVTRMARLACKFKPDWIIHLDADELWGGLSQLSRFDYKAFGSTSMYLHPPCRCQFDVNKMSHYLDFDDVTNLPGECKVGHRPDLDVVITHGNHGFENNWSVFYTKKIWRHHYPVRSLAQFERKAVAGHEALLRRNSVCERWQRWYNLSQSAQLGPFYNKICDSWDRMIQQPNTEDLTNMLELWSTPKVIRFFQESGVLPTIGQWPRNINEEQNNHS